jgi:hypothetical protein
MGEYAVLFIMLFFTLLFVIILGVKTFRKLRKLNPSKLKKEYDENLNKSSTGIFISSLLQLILEIFKL